MKIKSNTLRRIIRRRLIRENMIMDAWTWLKLQGSDAMADARFFLKNFKHELEQTADGTALLAKLVRGHKLTPTENAQLKVQLVDVGKGIPLMGLIILPGGGIAVMALVKIADKLGVDLMPSAFKRSMQRHR